jgi:tripartite-type tricarboxylate transporter receptor subunit TctC
MSKGLHRRQFLHLALGAAALPVSSRAVWAQAYPARPARILAGFPAGSTTDIIARLMGNWLQERLGQAFVIENRPGAGGNIAAEAAAHAPADGYTLLLVTSSHAINATLYPNLKFNILRDLAPIAPIVSVPNVMVVNASLPARTVPEFIAYAKANPGKLNMASAGNGTSSHLAGELFKMMAGINMVHVPYRGQAPALTDLLGGQVQVSFAPMPPSIEHIRAGKLRALAVTAAARWAALADTPAVAEFVPGYEASTWAGLAAPRGTPAELIDKLNKEINAGLADARVAATLADMGGIVLPGSAGDAGKLLGEETEKWAKVVKFAGLKPE